MLVAEHDAASLRGHLRRAETTAAELAAATDALADGGDPEALFPPRTSPGCSTCDVRRHCPEGRAAAPELASPAFCVASMSRSMLSASAVCCVSCSASTRTRSAAAAFCSRSSFSCASAACWA